jgi:hypothetical protein
MSLPGRCPVPGEYEPLRLLEAMFHTIPRANWSEDRLDGVIHSQHPTRLSPDALRFFEDLVAKAAASGRGIVGNPRLAGPVVPAILDLAVSPDHIVERSAELADRMFAVQAPGAPASVFVVARAVHGKAQKVVILKAEHQDGVKVNEPPSGLAGEISVEYLQSLIVGNNAEIYKLALLGPAPTAPGGIRGVMTDEQNGGSFAKYFLVDFLGCDLAVQNEQLVKDFVTSIEAMVNSDLVPPEKKFRYRRALAAELSSPDPTLAPQEWLSKHIDPGDRDAFAARLGETLATKVFKKDTRMLTGQVGGLAIQTNVGLTLSGPPEAFGDQILTTGIDDHGNDYIHIHARVTSSRLARSSAGKR